MRSGNVIIHKVKSDGKFVVLLMFYDFAIS